MAHLSLFSVSQALELNMGDTFFHTLISLSATDAAIQIRPSQTELEKTLSLMGKVFQGNSTASQRGDRY